jgi:hypothetical protein
MTDVFDPFLELPLWFSIIWVVVYLTLMVYVFYVLWRFRRKR